MTFKEIYRNKWVRFSFWAVLYILWVIWIRNGWWLFGLPLLYEFCVSQKLKAWIGRGKEGNRKGRDFLLGWLDAILFAVIVVSFINTFFFQAFKIPSSSMENSLMTGDRLFVSKLAYGPKMPQTPVSTPFVHNAFPSGKESYSTALQFGYKRIKGFGKLKRDDCVVFSFPNGDTVLRRAPSDDYYTLVRLYGRDYVQKALGPVVARPVDKKDHYVKRCVAVAGDTLRIVDGQVYVNGAPQKQFPGIRMTYKVVTDGASFNPSLLKELGVNLSELHYDGSLPGYGAMPLSAGDIERVRSLSYVVSVERCSAEEDSVFLFPFTSTGWTRDDYGPIWIPAKGSSVELNMDNLPLFRRIIEVYEGNELAVKDGKIFINGEIADAYTFKMDYYFMMGDNRHNSLDSRYWGFVPEDHIVGRPALIWLSTDANYPFPRNIRWKRFLKFV